MKPRTPKADNAGIESLKKSILDERVSLIFCMTPTTARSPSNIPTKTIIAKTVKKVIENEKKVENPPSILLQLTAVMLGAGPAIIVLITCPVVKVALKS